MYLCNQHTSQMKKLRGFFSGSVKKRWTIINNYVAIRAGEWVGYPIYYCKTQSLGGSFTMHDPNLWAQLNYASTQTQWGWVH